MLNSRKGNLLVYKWEVERFQLTHREKMATVKAVMQGCIADNPYEQYKCMYDKKKKALAATEKAREIHRENGMLVHRMATIFNEGGYQRCTPTATSSIHTYLD